MRAISSPPMLQSKAMDLHPVIVLLAVTVGGALFNVVGAFLAVPVAATIATCLRYHSETVALRAGETTVQDLDLATEQTEPAKLTLLLQRMMHRASDKPGKAPGKAEESEANASRASIKRRELAGSASVQVPAALSSALSLTSLSRVTGIPKRCPASATT